MASSAASPSLSLLSLTSKPPPPSSSTTQRLLPSVPNFAPLTLKSLRRNRSVIVRVEDVDADGARQDEYDMDDEEVEEVDNKKDYDVEYDPLAAAIAAASGGAGDGTSRSCRARALCRRRGGTRRWKPPDPDNDVYDFREMYVTPPDTDIYSIPRVLAPMPPKVQPFNPYWLLCVWNTYVPCSGADNGFCFNDVLQVQYIRCAMSDYGCYNVTEP
ncbi:hypothetical protein F2Q70_00040316 [Brassica cretica]|uniref:Uncharacterized protein n=1 Tax=Brassica cretica TaxID=69181 RepID=A0A8S9KDV6_BRACR|nr:hypothetical protein F2Q70_00040316 [Brassica cretica]